MDDLIAAIKNERRWFDKCLLILKYHNLQCSQHGEKRNHKWTIKDTAAAIDMSVGSVSENLNLAKAIPRIAGLVFLTREEALKKLREMK